MQFKRLFPTLIVLLSFLPPSFAQEHTYFTHGGAVQTVAYSPVNAALVASAGGSAAVKLWHLQNSTVTTLRGHTDTVNSIAFSPNGRLLVSGSDDYKIKVWNVSRHLEVASFQHITDNTMSQIKAVTFSPNGQRLATAGAHVKLWNTRNWREITTLRHDNWVWAVAFSPDGWLLAAAQNDGTVQVWDIQQERVIATLEGDPTAVFSVKFSPDNQILVSAGYTGQIKLWDAINWAHFGTLSANTGTVTEVAFSKDGTVVASTSHEVIELWAVDSGTKIAAFQGHNGWIRAAAFSSDSVKLASGGDDETLRLWDIAPYVDTQQLAGQDRVRLIYFLPSDRGLQPGIWTKLNNLIRDTQQLYVNEMQRLGFDRKTFDFETDENGETLVYRVDGQFNDWYYQTDTHEKVLAEVREQFDMSKDVYLIAVDISSEVINNEETCGIGGGNWFGKEVLKRTGGGYALIPASGACFNSLYVTAHELGHAFGLEHDFRNDAYLMSYGANAHQLSHCAAEWLDASRFFNKDTTSFNEPTTIHMREPRAALLQFELTDRDGLHQAQLIVPTTAADPAAGGKLHSCQQLNGVSDTVEFAYNGLGDEVVLQVIDAYGNITRQAHPTMQGAFLPVQNALDVNTDGTVDFTDLVPTETRLLANYPNPFNPETWIPYQLATDAEVALFIYDMHGHPIRRLDLGHQPAGIYHTRGRAAYWDGRNDIGEPVASGSYFYTFTAGNFTATGKMLLRK